MTIINKNDNKYKVGDFVIANQLIYPGVTRIEEMAFSGCAFESITLPKSLKTIERQVFKKCRKLKEINGGENITSIGRNAFYNSPLTDVYYEGSIAQWNAITKGTDWDANTGAYTVTCSD